MNSSTSSTAPRAALLAALLSAVLMFASFHPLQLSALIWVAWVPIWLVCANRPVRSAIGWGFLAQLLFFVSALFFVHRVTLVGWLVLAAYNTLYYLPFYALLSVWGRRHSDHTSRMKNLAWAAAIALAATGTEYARSILFTGFGWVPPAVSLHENLGLIQAAEWGGVAVLNGLVYFFNACLLLLVRRHRAELAAGPRGRRYTEALVGLALVMVFFGAGTWRLRALHQEPPIDQVPVVMVQPNIDQFAKWDRAFVDEIFTQLDELSRLARATHPDAEMMIWPETAIPDDGTLGYAVRQWLSEFSSDASPLLTGALYVRPSGAGFDYYNSAVLLGTWARILERYDKQHLVLFGEYIPSDFLMNLISAVTPFEGNVKAGDVDTVFHTPSGYPFSTLICFEDIFPYLARRFAKRDIKFLVNLTNDAWFDPYWGARQHAAHAVFRSVETRLPTARSTNSGLTCLIDRTGAVIETLESPDGRGNARIAGFMPARIPIYADREAPTPIVRYGAWFGQFGLGFLGGACGAGLVTRRRK